jgi:tetratricopeptide (TPR) repeat protein
MSLKPCLFCGIFVLNGLLAQPPQQSGPPDPAADFLRQGRQKLTEGKQDEALAIYKQAVESFPKSVQANNQTGVLLDLMGRYGEARKYFGKAIEVAPTPQAKGQAQRAMAMSYAFEGDCKNAAKYEGPLYEQYRAAKDYYNAGEMADELARVCIDADNLDDAYAWYRKGHEAGLNETDPKQQDLWNFRWEAQKHVAAAKAILDKGTNPQQAPFFPYLVGYVAFYGGDYRTALTELQKANQSDPFIQVLIAQTYEKLEDKNQAAQFYKKAMGSNAHNPPNAAARRLARKKVAG